MADSEAFGLLVADVRDIKQTVTTIAERVTTHEQQLRTMQKAPEEIRNWTTLALYAAGSVLSGFGCVGCLGSGVTICSAIIGVVVFVTTHH